jgi:hypothetical protein
MSDDFTLIQTSRLPEFATVRNTSALFGLSKTEIFDLIAKKKIQSIHYKKQAENKRGIRLIHLGSVREYLHGLL